MRARLTAPALVALTLVGALLAAGCATPAATADVQDVVESVPFEESETWRYELTDAVGTLVGHGVLSTRREGGRWVLEQRYDEAEPPEGVEPTSDRVTLLVDAETLKPIEGNRELVRRDAEGGVTRERYAWRYVEGEDGEVLVVEVTRDGETEEEQVPLREHHYDNESSLWLWRTLPFEPEYVARYISVDALDPDQQTVTVRLGEQQTVEAPAGRFEAWPVQVGSGRARALAMVSAEPPHQVVQWDNGELIFRLIGRE